METKIQKRNTGSVQIDAMEGSRNGLPEMPAPQGRTQRKTTGSNSGGAQKGAVNPTAGRGFSTQDQLKARAITSEAGSAPSSAQKAGSGPDGNMSVASTRSELTQAAQKAKDKIDADLANMWKQQVEDLRAWREKNVGKIDAEDLDSQYFRDSEAYMLLAQRAKGAKDTIDTQVNAFQSHLDENETAISGNDDKNKMSELMKERETNLRGTIADINNQSEIFSALCDNTVNKMRVGTDKSPERQYSSSVRDKPGADGGLCETSQADIEKSADQIQLFANQVSDAEHAAQAKEIPKIDNHRERELAYVKELGIAAKSLSGQLQNLTENKTTAQLLANKRWNIPGKAESMAGLGLVGVAASAKSFYDEVSDYSKKASNGNLTSDDRMKMAKSTVDLMNSLAPYVPVIGPVISPFLTVANLTLDLISENKHTPVEDVFSQLKSQSGKNLFRGYPSIEPPKL